MVKSLVAEDAILEKYTRMVTDTSKENINRNLMLSFLMSFSQFAQFLLFGVVYIAFAYWHSKYNISISDFYTGVFALFYGVFGAGMANQFLGDIGKAQAAKVK